MGTVMSQNCTVSWTEAANFCQMVNTQEVPNREELGMRMVGIVEWNGHFPIRPAQAAKVVYLERWTSFFETFPVGPNRPIGFWTEIAGYFR